jgi:lipopolysaccharide transport system permease protein
MLKLSSFHEALRHRAVTGALARCELAGRYRSALFGNAGMLITHLLMLRICTLVFGVIFKSRWPHQASQVVGAIAVQL